MVDSVNNNAIHSLIRAQQAANTAALATQKPPTTINQTRHAAIVPVSNASVQQGTKLAGSSSDKILPRGSIVDKLV